MSTSGIKLSGLASGLDTDSIISQLMEIEHKPIDLVQTQIDTAQSKEDAYNELRTKVLALQTATTPLSISSTFSKNKVTSSNESLLTATTGTGAVAGDYSFTVAQIAQSHQMVSSGFSSQTGTIGSGTLNVELGNGVIDRQTELETLNGGKGVGRGSIRITDRSGASSTIDLSGAVSVSDVLDKINSASGLSVTASLSSDGNKIVLSDASGGSSNLKVQNVGTGTTATDLGLAGSVASDTMTGKQVNRVLSTTKVSSINDGLGIRDVSGNDISITNRAGTTTQVDLSGTSTLQDVLDVINAAGAGVTAKIASDGMSLELDDTSGGAGSVTVTALNGSKAAQDLGLVDAGQNSRTVAGAAFNGKRLIAGMNDMLLRNISGANASSSGIALGKIDITNKNGVTATVDLSGAQSIQDVVGLINANGPAGVTASFNSEGNGLELTDETGGSSKLKVAENGSTTASDLGILNAAGTDEEQLHGKDLDAKYVSSATLLKNFNMGVGVTAGSMLITDKNGSTGTITLTIADDTTVGDILTQINDQASTAGLDVTATVNDTGDGIQLLDTSGGVGSLTVAESGGTTAKDLNLLGTSTSTTLDGSFEYKITVDATDTLSDVALEINNLNRGVAASVLNDGNSTNPYRLNLVSRVSGSAGRMTVNSDISGMNFSTSSRAQDSVLLLGSTSGGTSPMALINSSNTVSDAIPGVTLNLKSVSTSPVTISVSKDTSGIQKQVESFVTAVNNALSEISDLTSFDASTMDKGVLFGEQAPLTIKNSLIRTLTSTLKGDSLSGYTRLSQIGLSFNSDGELELDADKLTTALTTDPESVKSLFTGIAEKATSATQVSKINNGAGFTTLSDTGADLEITTHDGSSYQIDISGLSMMQQIIDKINSDTGGKVTAKIGSDGYRLQLVDNTTGTTSFSVADYNGSTAATDLKISRSTTEATITGTNLFLEKTTKGIAEQYTALLTNITDASSGTIYHQTNSLASQITSLNETITKMEARLEAKQARLEAQFTAMETAMSSLQTQQSALDQMFGTSSSSSSSSSS